MSGITLVPSRGLTAWIFGVGGAITVMIAATAWLMLRDVVPEERVEVKTISAKDKAAIESAQVALQARLPKAVAAFDKMTVRWMGEEPAVCGQVDLDEPDDAFDGFERFIYFEGQTFIDQEEGTDAVAQKWKDICL